MIKRIFLFLITNIAILAVLSIAIKILGLDHYLGVSQNQLYPFLIIAVLMGFGGSFISLMISKWMAKNAYNIQVIEKPSSETEHWLVSTIQRQSQMAGIPTPEVGIYESPECNAFATGPTRNNAIVAVSSGLLRQMNQQQVEGVLAHEISHIANGDMVTLALIQGILNTFVIFLSRVVGFLIDRMLSRDEERSTGMGFFLGTMLSQMVFGFLATMVVLFFSRRREFAADADAAKLWGKGPMIAALQQLQRITSQNMILDDRSKALAAFKINHKQGRGLGALFASHPPLQDRIEALQLLP